LRCLCLEFELWGLEHRVEGAGYNKQGTRNRVKGVGYLGAAVRSPRLLQHAIVHLASLVIRVWRSEVRIQGLRVY